MTSSNSDILLLTSPHAIAHTSAHNPPHGEVCRARVTTAELTLISSNQNNSFQSQSDLEIAIVQAMKSMVDAIVKKEFSKATKYEAELEKLESLRPTLPSLEELKQN